MNITKTNIKAFLLGLLLSAFLLYLNRSLPNLRNEATTDVTSNTLVELTNQFRLDNNLNELVTNPLLERAAQLKANNMAEKGYFAHVSPEGVTPWDWFKKVDYEFMYAGENLAVNFSESEDVAKAWMKSPSHKDNILDTRYTEVGIATTEGVYKGKKSTFVVQMFASPMTESKTEYLAEVLKESEKLETIATSNSWDESGKMEIYLAVKKLRNVTYDSPAYQRIMNKLMYLINKR